jgi:hypothetical protein
MLFASFSRKRRMLPDQLNNNRVLVEFLGACPQKTPILAGKIQGEVASHRIRKTEEGFAGGIYRGGGDAADAYIYKLINTEVEMSWA